MRRRKLKNKLKDCTGYIVGFLMLMAMGLGEPPM